MVHDLGLFDTVPDDIIQEVLSKLGCLNSITTCKRWEKLLHMSISYLKLYSKDIDKEVWYKVAKFPKLASLVIKEKNFKVITVEVPNEVCLHGLKELIFKSQINITSEDLNSLFKSCINLEKLVINSNAECINIEIDTDKLHVLQLRCSEIKIQASLRNLWNCEFMGINISSGMIERILKTCPYLTSFSVKWIFDTDTSLFVMCSTLNKLYIARCNAVHIEGCMELYDLDIEYVKFASIKKCNRLKVIFLKNILRFEHGLSNLNQTEELHMIKIGNMDRIEISNLLLKCPNLHTLRLTCDNFDIQSPLVLVLHMNFIKRIYIKGVKDLELKTCYNVKYELRLAKVETCKCDIHKVKQLWVSNWSSQLILSLSWKDVLEVVIEPYKDKSWSVSDLMALLSQTENLETLIVRTPLDVGINLVKDFLNNLYAALMKCSRPIYIEIEALYSVGVDTKIKIDLINVVKRILSPKHSVFVTNWDSKYYDFTWGES